MIGYAIVELDDGMTVVEVPVGQTPEDVAIKHSGVLIDPGPYPTYDEAYDALIALPMEEEEELS